MVTRAAKDHLGRFHHRAGGGGEPGEAVFTDADDMQPGGHQQLQSVQSSRQTQ